MTPEEAVQTKAPARAFSGVDRETTHDTGRVIAYCDAPTFLIERPDGSQFSWRADLTETVEVAAWIIEAVTDYRHVVG